MTLETMLSISGIALNTLGIVLIFAYGLSPLVSTDGYLMMYQEDIISDKKSKPNKKKKRYFLLASTGLALCIIGNALQIIAFF